MAIEQGDIPRRLGVFGGTFDPIHYGHLVAAQEVLSELRLDQVLFVPAGWPPHKPHRRLSTIRARVEMVELAISSNPRFVLSRIDIDRPGPSYTVNTLDLLHQQMGMDTELYFIMGLDSLADLPRWHQPDRIIQLAYLVVVDRPRYDVDMEALTRAVPGIEARLLFVHIPGMNIASSDLQRRVRENKPIKYQVPEAVEYYIYSNGLYRL